MAPEYPRKHVRAIRLGVAEHVSSAGLWLSDGQQVLLTKRAPWLDHPGTYTVPGGGIQPGETVEAAACREYTEETGWTPPHTILGSEAVDGFCLVYALVDEADAGWTPVLNNESTDYVWADHDWIREHFDELHPGLQDVLSAQMKTAKRDTIDKTWIDRVRKTWKAWLKRRTQVGYMKAAEYLQEGQKWVEALGRDLAFTKGFFTFLREDKKQHTEIYKMRLKAMQELEQAARYLYGGRKAIEFWDNTMTPGTKEYRMGGSHRLSMIETEASAMGLPKPKNLDEADELAKNNPRLIEKALSKQTKSLVTEGTTKADAVFSRKFLSHLTRIVNKWGDIEWGTTEREFSVGNMKVVMVDIPMPWVQEAKGHLPSEVTSYVRQLHKAEALLKQKGLGFLWYGVMFVACKGCGGENPLGKRFGVGAQYNIGPDNLTVYSDPHGNLYRLIVHELGHRYYYKFMDSGARARFNAEFGDVPSVSEYGGTVAEEDFAEVFSYYIDNRDLTRDQIDRLKRFLTSKGKRANEDDDFDQLTVDRLVMRYLTEVRI